MLFLDWQLGRHGATDDAPTEWIPATLPGAVQLDWARAHDWPPLDVGTNYRHYDGLEDYYWTYRTRLELPSLEPGQRLFFVCGGVDYACEVWLNNRRLHVHEGMFTPIELELTGRAANGDELRVVVLPAPKSVAEPRTRVQANQSCKPAVSYEWDFHPRLIPLGIWQQTYLDVRPAAFLCDVAIDYTLNADFSRAKLTANVAVSDSTAEDAEQQSEDSRHEDTKGRSVEKAREAQQQALMLSEPSSLRALVATFQTTSAATRAADLRVRWTLTGPDGQLAATASGPLGETLHAEIANPRLWWPHDQGEPARYTSVVELLDGESVLDRRERRIGLRRAQLVMNAGSWDEPKRFPKPRSRPPMQLQINGRSIFAKGANWVSPDIFPGVIDREIYAAQLSLAKRANMNIIRLWGGAPAQKEPFYELCDELGIMVWQEFPLACNDYPDDTQYLQVLDQESRSLIVRLRQHPSLTIWCGGNELFNNWSGMTDQALALRLLNRNCYELDPRTPFLPTSPVDGVGHGFYVFRDMLNGEESWHMFARSDFTAYCEFGMPGPAPLHVLRRIIPEADLFPPRAGTAWQDHHAFDAWQPGSWLHVDVIEHYFGPSATLEQLVERANLLQSAGYKGLFEEARRQKPRAAMALNWCLNEPWPNAANNSLIAWPCEPKPALDAVGESLRPVLASARIEHFAWAEGESFNPELWLLSDAPESTPGGTLEAWLHWDGNEQLLLAWQFAALPANTNLRGPQAQIALPAVAAGTFELVLRVAGRPEFDSTYTLAVRRVHQQEQVERRLNM